LVTIFRAHIKDGVVVPDAPLDIPDGTAVDVRIVGRPSRKSDARLSPNGSGASMLELLKMMPAPGVFKSSHDADEYLRSERDSWDN
jgi:hypothetical protein